MPGSQKRVERQADGKHRDMMWAKIVSDEATIKDFCYEPLRSGETYKAEAIRSYSSAANSCYTRVFFSFDGEERSLDVHNRHLLLIGQDEHREEKLRELGI